MKSRIRLWLCLFATGSLFVGIVRAQDKEEDPLKAPDFDEALREVQELGKDIQISDPSKLTDLKKKSDDTTAKTEEDAAKEKAELKARLEKQMADPSPAKFPEWMPPIASDFKAAGEPRKKVVEDEVRFMQTGTSQLGPRELLAAWEAAIVDKPLNHFNNDIASNGNLTMVLDISSRSDPTQKVTFEARRAIDEKVTHVTVWSSLPKPTE